MKQAPYFRFMQSVFILVCLAGLIGCSKQNASESSQAAAPKNLVLTPNQDFRGSVEVEYDKNGNTERAAAITTTSSKMTEALQIIPTLSKNPAAKGHEIFARPFRGRQLVMDKEFSLGEGWTVWHGERLLYSGDEPTSTGMVGNLELPTGSAAITNIDFIKSPYSGQVTIKQGDKVVASVDLCSSTEEWVTIKIPPSAARIKSYIVTLPAEATNLKWSITLNEGTAASFGVQSASLNGILYEGANVAKLLKMPPQKLPGNKLSIPILTE